MCAFPFPFRINIWLLRLCKCGSSGYQLMRLLSRFDNAGNCFPDLKSPQTFYLERDAVVLNVLLLGFRGFLCGAVGSLRSARLWRSDRLTRAEFWKNGNSLRCVDGAEARCTPASLTARSGDAYLAYPCNRFVAATRLYHNPESLTVRFWSRKSTYVSP
jgi:hypothetical protein